MNLYTKLDWLMVLIHIPVVLKYTLIALVDLKMPNGVLSVMTFGEFLMLEWPVVNWDTQMLWQLHVLHVMVKELDQFGLMM